MEFRTELKALQSAESAAPVNPAVSTEDLQREIDARRAAVDELNDSLAKITSELARVEKRPFEISARLPETQRELSEIREQLASPKLAGEAASPSRVADRILLQARQSRLLSEAEMLDQEQLSQSVRENLLRARRELLKGRLKNADAALDTLEALLQERLTIEAERVAALAEMIPADMPEGDEAAQELAAGVQALVKEFEDVVQNLKRAKAAQDDVMARLERLTDRYESVREQLEVSVGGRGMAQILADMQRRFRDQLAYTKGLATQVAPLDETRLAALQVRAKLRSQPEVESQFTDHPSDVVATLVTTRREVLEQLQTQYGNLTRALAALEGDKTQYLDRAEEVRIYALQQLYGFGTRSAPPITVETLTEIPGGLQWFFRGERWVELGRAMQGMAARMPVLSMVIVFVVAVLLLTRSRIGAALERIGVKVRRVSTDRYAYTGEALLWTFLLALPIPLLIGFAGWVLEQTPESSAWLQGIAQGLQIIAWIAFVLAFLAAVCRPGGVGVDHFRWKEQPLARLRRGIHGFAVVYIPALLITLSGMYEAGSEYFFSVGRISFMLAHAGTTIVLWQLLNFSDGMLATFMREQPTSLIARWRYLWFPLVLAYPLALVVIAGLGYMITAIHLSFGFLETAAYIAAGTILYRLARRWFRIKERRLALAETLERRRARQAAAVAQGQKESVDVVSVDPEASKSWIWLPSVSRRGTCCGCSLAWVWQP